MGLHDLLKDNLTLFVDDICTLYETNLWASTACYEDSFTFLCVCDVRTSQETRLRASTAGSGIVVLLYVDDDHTSQETHL
jgi:hypothetical protein